MECSKLAKAVVVVGVPWAAKDRATKLARIREETERLFIDISWLSRVKDTRKNREMNRIKKPWIDEFAPLAREKP